MKVLFVASECAPFAKTGGLGDVVGSLPLELQKQGVDVRVILPKYGSIAQNWREQMELSTTFEVSVGWRRQYCGIEELVHEGITYYFIDNEYYFRRHGYYGYADEAERFAFFNRAVLDALPHLDFQADTLHCHDWQSAMIPLFLHAHYRHIPFYQSMRTVFTIHNLKYQGIFPYSILQDLLHLGHEYFTIDGVEFHGLVNFMKAALNYADRLTTVSPSYAMEIQSPYYGEKLDGLLRKRSAELQGIVNGIDYKQFNPLTDPHIFVKYKSSLEKKQANKLKLQEMLGLRREKDVPLIGLVTRLVEQKGIDLIAHVLREILQLNVQVVVLGTGDAKYEELFQNAAWHHPEQVSAQIAFDEGIARKIYAASDLFLMPSRFEPCGIGQLIALRYATAPIVRETGGLKDTVHAYNEFSKAGNGFSFTHYNAHDMLFTIERAVKLYHDKEQWQQLTRNMVATNYSWQESAKKYIELYHTL